MRDPSSDAYGFSVLMFVGCDLSRRGVLRCAAGGVGGCVVQHLDGTSCKLHDV
jgi:hypothetical protein